MYSTEQLLEKISAEQACGEDLSFSVELDAIAKARQADDPSLDQGAWVTTLKEADWPFVASRCAKLIATRSKDLQLAVWLTEAQAKTAGFRGLADGLMLVAGLCDRYWESLYPRADEGGYEQRIGNLCWLAARVPQLLLEIPISEGRAFSLREIEAAHQRQSSDPDVLAEIDSARRGSSRGFYQQLIADTGYCLHALAELERVIDDRLGADGPGFTAARANLQSVVHALTPAAREAGALADVAVVEEGAAPAQEAPLASGALETRAQALAQLRAIADFFRRTEPHSPVAYLADKAAAWGEQPLHLWLRTVVKDPATLAQLDDLLGVQ